MKTIKTNFYRLITMLSLAILLFGILVPSLVFATTYYVNSTGGNDANNASTIYYPIKTINETNYLTLIPGDTVSFSCDSTFRVTTDAYPRFQSGNSSANITYNSYGSCNGRKPIFLGSYNWSSTSDWRNVDTNLWQAVINVTHDIGNLIFNSTDEFYSGFGAWNKTNSYGSLDQQSEFFYNLTNSSLTMYSTANPATLYNRIEASTREYHHGLNDTGTFELGMKSYIHVDGLDVRYCGYVCAGHYGTTVTSYIYHTNMSYSWGGGTYQTGTTPLVRQGAVTDISLWSNHIYYQYSRFYQGWDNAIGFQAWASGGQKEVNISNIYIQYNILSHANYLIEYFSSNRTHSFTQNVTIDHNTLAYAGFQWDTHRESDANYGRGMDMRRSPVNTYNFNITNNLFYDVQPANNGFLFKIGADSDYVNGWHGAFPQNDYNLYDRANYTRNIFNYNNTGGNLTQIQKNGLYNNTNMNSIETYSLFVSNITGESFFLQPRYDSPACGAGSGGSDIGAEPCISDCEYNLSQGVPCVLSSSLTMDAGQVFNVSGVAITITANNTVLDCNGAIIYSNSSHGIFWNNKENVTVQNCILASSGFLNNGIYAYQSNRPTIQNNIVAGWNNGIYLAGSINSTVYNNSVYNSNFVGIYALGSAPYASNNSLIMSNRIINVSKYSIANDYQANLKILGNLIVGLVTKNGTMLITNAIGTNISFNTIIDVKNTTTSKGIYLLGSNSSNVEYNYVMRTPESIFLGSTVDTTIRNNYLYDADIGLYLYTAKNTNSTSNTFNNISFNSDGYNVGIYSTHNSWNFISLNDIVEYGHVGIWIQQSENITITNPTCRQISLADIVAGRLRDARTWSRAGSNPYHYYEPTACILLGEQYEGWLGDSTETMADSITKFRKFNVTNVAVSGIIINDNVQTYLHAVGVFGTIAYSLPTSWNRSIWIQLNLTDQDEFYNNPSFSTLQIVPSTISGISSQFLKSRAGMNNPAFDDTNYTIARTYMTFYGKVFANITLNDIGINYSVYNISNSSVLVSNVASYNISMEPSGKYLAWFPSLTTDGCIPTVNCTTATPTKLSEYSPVSSALLYNGVAVLMAILILIGVGYPVWVNHDQWGMEEWLKWLVISLVIVFFGLIVITNIFTI